MTERELSSRRDVAISVVLFLPTWSEAVFHDLVSFSRLHGVHVFGPLYGLTFFVLTYALSFGFALSALRVGEGSGRFMGGVILGAEVALAIAWCMPRFK
ncbi:MAG: hypothetical protein AMXMBFR82_06600 [Candidatus Hydrogenedentota bacterium]